MKKIFVMCAALLFAISGAMAQDGLQLKDIAEGKPTAERLSAVTPLGDGESYAMISSDGKRILKYSFKSGQQTGVLFDVDNTVGEKVD